MPPRGEAVDTDLVIRAQRGDKAAYALLARIPVKRGAAGLLESATGAVQALAKAG